MRNWCIKGEPEVVSKETEILFSKNEIHTSKYNAFSFIPLNLYEQFSRFSNIYFLVMGILEMIPAISTSNGLPVIYFPLVFIIFLTALKDLVEDYKRHKSDKKENSILVWRLK